MHHVQVRSRKDQLVAFLCLCTTTARMHAQRTSIASKILPPLLSSQGSSQLLHASRREIVGTPASCRIASWSAEGAGRVLTMATAGCNEAETAIRRKIQELQTGITQLEEPKLQISEARGGRPLEKMLKKQLVSLSSSTSNQTFYIIHFKAPPGSPFLSFSRLSCRLFQSDKLHLPTPHDRHR